MNVTAICATKGRHILLERSVRFFLEQDTEGTLLIFNNSNVSQKLWIGGDKGGVHIFDKRIILVNHPLDSRTGKPYTNLGAIYNDALHFVPNNCNIITHWDDDDIFLPNHISEGIKGLKRAKYASEFMVARERLEGREEYEHINKAYKPAKSYYRSAEGIHLMGNNLEPSIFVYKEHLDLWGYSHTTTEQHLQWMNPLLQNDEIFVDPKGVPTLVYNWGDTQIPTWKTSGDPTNPKNFDNYTNFSQDHGDQVITPWTKEEVEPYYEQIKEFNGSTT